MFAAATAVRVVGQTGGLSALFEVSGPARGALSFALVLLAGVGLLTRRESAVDRAVDLAVDGTPLSVVYGLIAFGLLAFAGGYVVTQLGQLTGRAVLLQLSLAALGLAATALAGFGYLILGTWLTQGTALSAAPTTAPAQGRRALSIWVSQVPRIR